MHRFMIPNKGDKVKIHPLVKKEGIRQITVNDTLYWCLPLFNVNRQRVEVYYIERDNVGEPYDLLGRMFQDLTKDFDFEFNDYEIYVYNQSFFEETVVDIIAIYNESLKNKTFPNDEEIKKYIEENSSEASLRLTNGTINDRQYY